MFPWQNKNTFILRQNHATVCVQRIQVFLQLKDGGTSLSSAEFIYPESSFRNGCTSSHPHWAHCRFPVSIGNGSIVLISQHWWSPPPVPDAVSDHALCAVLMRLPKPAATGQRSLRQSESIFIGKRLPVHFVSISDFCQLTRSSAASSIASTSFSTSAGERAAGRAPPATPASKWLRVIGRCTPFAASASVNTNLWTSSLRQQIMHHFARKRRRHSCSGSSTGI